MIVYINSLYPFDSHTFSRRQDDPPGGVVVAVSTGLCETIVAAAVSVSIMILELRFALKVGPGEEVSDSSRCCRRRCLARGLRIHAAIRTEPSITYLY